MLAELKRVHFTSPCGRWFGGEFLHDDNKFIGHGRHHTVHKPTAGCEYNLTGRWSVCGRPQEQTRQFLIDASRVSLPTERRPIIDVLCSFEHVTRDMATLAWAEYGQRVWGHFEDGCSDQTLKPFSRVINEMEVVDHLRYALYCISTHNFTLPIIPSDEPLNVTPLRTAADVVFSTVADPSEAAEMAHNDATEDGLTCQVITHPFANARHSAEMLNEVHGEFPTFQPPMICNVADTYASPGVAKSSAIGRNEIGRVVKTKSDWNRWKVVEVEFSEPTRRVLISHHPDFPEVRFSDAFAISANRLEQDFDVVVAVVPDQCGDEDGCVAIKRATDLIWTAAKHARKRIVLVGNASNEMVDLARQFDIAGTSP